MSNLTLFTSSHNAQVLPSFYNEKLISIYLDTSFKNTVGIFLITVTIASTNNFGSTIVNLKFTEDNPSTSITMIFQIDIAQKPKSTIFPKMPKKSKLKVLVLPDMAFQKSDQFFLFLKLVILAFLSNLFFKRNLSR